MNEALAASKYGFPGTFSCKRSALEASLLSSTRIHENPSPMNVRHRCANASGQDEDQQRNYLAAASNAMRDFMWASHDEPISSLPAIRTTGQKVEITDPGL
jgi:hypothetical protein